MSTRIIAIGSTMGSPVEDSQSQFKPYVYGGSSPEARDAVLQAYAAISSEFEEIV